MQRIAKLSARLGVALHVVVANTGATWIGFNDPELRVSSSKKTDSSYKPEMTYGEDFDSALANFLGDIRGRELSWPGYNISDNHAVRVPRNLSV